MNISRRARTAALLAAVVVIGINLISVPAGPESEQARIDRINRELEAKGLHWTAGTTSVSQLSLEEKKALCGDLPDLHPELPYTQVIEAPEGAAYDIAFDWRAHDGVTPVKNQGGCGGCWAFTATGQLESHVLIYDHREENLSEQQVIDCNQYGGSCSGGNAGIAYSVQMDYGAVNEACYPYIATDIYPCTETDCESVAKVASYAYVSSAVSNIKEALLSGPVYSHIDVVDRFYDYIQGCFSSSDPIVGSHAVLIIGWDDMQCGGEGAWLIKNSWGINWGMHGFGYVKYGSNGIGTGVYQITYNPSDVLVDLFDPDGGETLDVDQSYLIQWGTSRSIPDSLSIMLSINGGESYDYRVASNLPGTATTYDWTVPALPVTTARVKVIAWTDGDISGFDFSRSDFTIKGKPYRYVSTTGLDIYPYSIPLWAARSIQDAIDASIEGDSIMVETGTYNERVSISRLVHLMGGWNTGFIEWDPVLYPTTINSNGSTVSFILIPGTGCGIEGFVITGGTGTSTQMPDIGLFGGGIFSYDASPLIARNTITNCGYVSAGTYSAGGGIACYLGTPEIIGNSITDCVAQSGGGIYLYQSAATISGNVITGSQPDPVYSAKKYGGGIYIRYSTATLSGNVISGNIGYSNGGGICSWMGALTLSGDSISGNSVLSNGGGIASERSSLDVVHTVITGNSGSIGAGIFHKAAQIDLANSLITLNTASVIAGGIHADSCWGTFENNTIDRNSGQYGIGNFFIGTSLGCDITNNHITFGSPTGFQSIYEVNISYSYNNAFGNPGGDVVTLVPDGTNISADPLYADTLTGDYHHTLLSPGIDAGNPAIGTDPDGSRTDIGMFGGPEAMMSHPWAVQNCTASALNDTTIRISWDLLLSPGLANFVVFGDTATGFTPSTSNLLGTSLSMVTEFDHSPLEGCWNYKVCAINVSGYSGGYSNEAGDCLSGGDILPPSVTVSRPSAAETFMAGDTLLIEWIATDENSVDSVAISYSLNAGADFTLLSSGEPNDSAYTWVMPLAMTGSDSCVVRVEAWDPSENTGTGYSGGYFTILDYVTGTGDTPTATALMQNYPNPFNGHTTVIYALDKPGRVSVRIYDTAGRLVRTLVDGDHAAGTWQVGWNGQDNRSRPVTSGIYFMKMVAGEYSRSRKIIYLR